MEELEEQNISVKTANLADTKGCELDLYSGDWEYEDKYGDTYVCNFNPSKDDSKVRKNLRQKTNCTQSLLQTWLRKRNIIVSVDIDDNDKYFLSVTGMGLFGEYDSWEEALEVGLEEGLKKYRKPRKKIVKQPTYVKN